MTVPHLPHFPAFFYTSSSRAKLATMLPNNNEGAKSSRKRKMKEVATEPNPTPTAINQINLFNLRGEPQQPPPGVPSIFGSSSSQVHQILNNAAPFKPFSYTALLTAPDPEEYARRNPSDPIDEILTSHNQSLKSALLGMVDKLSEETAAKKLKEKESEHFRKNAELEQMVEHYKKEAYKFAFKVRSLQQTNLSLRTSLQEANTARRLADSVEEDAESSFVDPNRVGPVRLDCKACEKQVATVMMWPCRHVCVCAACDVITKSCPVCHLPKTTSVEVCLPHNDD